MFHATFNVRIWRHDVWLIYILQLTSRFFEWDLLRPWLLPRPRAWNEKLVIFKFDTRHLLWVIVTYDVIGIEFVLIYSQPPGLFQNASFKLHARGQCGRSMSPRTFIDRPGPSLFMGAKLNAWFSEEFWCNWCRFRFGDIKDSLKANHHTTINCVGGDRIREFDQMRAIGLNIGSTNEWSNHFRQLVWAQKA